MQVSCRAAAGDRRPARRRRPLGRHPPAADDRARGARREPDLSHCRRRERLDSQSGERHDGRRREGSTRSSRHSCRPSPSSIARSRSYYTALEMLYRDASALPGSQPRSQSHDSARADAGIERMADGLRNMGVSNSQLREMAKRRELVQDIQRGVAGGRLRPEAQRLAWPPVRSRIRVLPDRRSEPGVDSGGRVPRPASVYPPRRLGADHLGRSEPRADRRR